MPTGGVELWEAGWYLDIVLDESVAVDSQHIVHPSQCGPHTRNTRSA